MANRLALAFALILMPTAAAAQLSDDVVVVALNHKQYLDVPSLCCPPLAWATFGEGRWRLQVDYLRSYREDEGHGNHPLDDVDGRRSSVQRVDLRIESQHHANVLVSWRALGRPGDSSVSVLFVTRGGHDQLIWTVGALELEPVAGVGARQTAQREQPRHEAEFGVGLARLNELVDLVETGEVVPRLGCRRC